MVVYKSYSYAFFSSVIRNCLTSGGTSVVMLLLLTIVSDLTSKAWMYEMVGLMAMAIWFG